jgi:hypothetical protein
VLAPVWKIEGKEKVPLVDEEEDKVQVSLKYVSMSITPSSLKSHFF